MLFYTGYFEIMYHCNQECLSLKIRNESSSIKFFLSKTVFYMKISQVYGQEIAVTCLYKIWKQQPSSGPEGTNLKYLMQQEADEGWGTYWAKKLLMATLTIHQSLFRTIA